MNNKEFNPVIFILGAMAAIAPFSIDMYLPAFPAIAQDLQTDISHVTLSLTSFFIGISVGQLFYGPILDRMGRKKPLLFGVILYTVASLGCTFAFDVKWLIALRLLQALGGCASMVAVRAIIRDVYPVTEIAGALSSLMLVMGVAPIIAPTVGGMLLVWLGWRSIFFALVVFGILLAASIIFFLKESKEPDPTISLRPDKAVMEYFGVLKNTQFLAFALCSGFTSAGMFAYISGSPFVYIKLFGISEAHYGWIFGVTAFGFIFSSQISRLLLRRFNSSQITYGIGGFQAACGLILLIGTALGFTGIVGTVLLVFLYMSCQGILHPNTTAMALSPFDRNAGAASAMIGFFQMFFGAAASALVSRFHNNTAIPMVGVMACCTGLAFTCLLLKAFGGTSKEQDFQEGVTEQV